MRISLLAALMAATALIPGAALAQRTERTQEGDADRGGDRQARIEARAAARAERPQPEQARPEQSRPEQSRAQQPRPEQPRPEQARAGQPRFDRGSIDGAGPGRGNRFGNALDGGSDNARHNFYATGPQPQRPQAQAQVQAQAQAQFNSDQNRGNRPDGRGGNTGQWRGNRGGNDGQVPGTPGYRGNRDDIGNRGQNRNNDWRGNDHRGVTITRGNDLRGDLHRSENRYADRAGNDHGAWNRDWRRDDRYDWNRRREYDRSAFHLPRYYAPSGWNYGYRRFNIGFTLSAGLFRNNYWISDSYYYGLPEAYGSYRWVRYYNDALLVDIYSGQVVDTVYDIFW